jgi:hypothetical protein
MRHVVIGDQQERRDLLAELTDQQEERDLQAEPTDQQKERDLQAKLTDQQEELIGRHNSLINTKNMICRRIY